MKYLLIACFILAGCSENKCIDNRTAYKSGDIWVIPNGAYECREGDK